MTAASPQGGYATVNGLNPYYEIHGSGAPLILLHGGLGSTSMLGAVLEVAALKLPVLLVFGDADSVPPAHAAQYFKLLGGGKADAGWQGSGLPASRLAILPATTHYNIFSPPALAPIVAPFLDAMPPL